DRLAPSVTLFYYGPGSTLNLLETSAGNDTVTVSEPASNTLRISLGGATFDVASSTAPGLSYGDPDSPGTPNYVDVGISVANAVRTLAIDLGAGSDSLNVGMTNAAGGVGSISVSESGGGTLSTTLNALSLSGGDLNISGGPIVTTVGAAITTHGGAITLVAT